MNTLLETLGKEAEGGVVISKKFRVEQLLAIQEAHPDMPESQREAIVAAPPDADLQEAEVRDGLEVAGEG